MDLYGPNPRFFPNRMLQSIYADSESWSATQKKEKNSARVKRSSAATGTDGKKNFTLPADKKVEFLLLPPNEGLGREIPATSTPLAPTPMRRTSLIQDAGELSEEFLTQNAILLTVACMGAFILFTVNLVGIFLFKGYFKRKAQALPLGVVGLYPQSLSHSRRCRYHTILRRFSLDSQHDSAVDAFRQISEPPIVGPVSLSLDPQPSVSEMRRQPNAFTVLDLPEIILMNDYQTYHLSSNQTYAQRDLGANALQVLKNSKLSPNSRGWKERFKKSPKCKEKIRQEGDNKNNTILEGSSIRGGTCSILKSANGNTAVLPKRRVQHCNGVHTTGMK